MTNRLNRLIINHQDPTQASPFTKFAVIPRAAHWMISKPSSAVSGCATYDAFGMSPLHLIATSNDLRSDMLETLLEYYSLDTISHKDFNGKTMLDDLLMRNTLESQLRVKMVFESAALKLVPGWGLEPRKLGNLETCKLVQALAVSLLGVACVASQDWNDPDVAVAELPDRTHFVPGARTLEDEDHGGGRGRRIRRS